MNSRYPYLILLTSILFAGCADNIDNSVTDFCVSGDYQNCLFKDDAGECLPEAGCTNPVKLVRDTYLGDFEGNLAENNVRFANGYAGRIDTGCHSLNSSEFGGDTDWIAVHAKAGTPLFAVVTVPNQSKANPVVYLHNKAGGELIYSKNNKMNQAMLKFIAPDDLFYISVEDMANYDYSYQSSCSDNISGGSNYTYSLYIQNADIPFTDLGLVDFSIDQTASFKSRGDSNYYKVQMKKTAQLHITIAPTESNHPLHRPVMSPLSSNAEYAGATDYSWVIMGKDLERSLHYEDTLSILDATIDQKYANCNDTQCEYSFVVTDYEGSDGYEYKMTIQARPK